MMAVSQPKHIAWKLSIKFSYFIDDIVVSDGNKYNFNGCMFSLLD